MKLYNPTPYNIEARADGVDYYIPSGGEIECWLADHVNILLNSKGYLGLVHLVYDTQMQKKYPSFEEFKKDQSLIGLKALRAHVQEAWVNERQVEADIKHNKGGEADKAFINADKFKEKLELVDLWIKRVQNPIVEEVVLQESVEEAGVSAAAAVSTGGKRRRARSGSADYQDQSAAEAG